MPKQTLTTAMRKHQRYLPVQANHGTLLSLFVTLANGVCDLDVVRDGNETCCVRFEDVAFFWNSDLKIPPRQFRARLAELTFEQRLGSMADRADRTPQSARFSVHEQRPCPPTSRPS
ncbi:glycine--tRNA ligase subunit beta [Nocardia sp. NPDC049190]|uniref:glycine--tRNA ligase subunit beta n=1 Tax=Nocardia sp. NPDC049190 TaxID=3155650 RepID=UPI0033DA9EA4